MTEIAVAAAVMVKILVMDADAVVAMVDELAPEISVTHRTRSLMTALCPASGQP